MILTALVETKVLSQHFADPDWIVFDCRHDLADPARGRAEYAASHIPGARFLPLDEDLSAPKTGRNGRHPAPVPRISSRNSDRPESTRESRSSPTTRKAEWRLRGCGGCCAGWDIFQWQSSTADGPSGSPKAGRRQRRC